MLDFETDAQCNALDAQLLDTHSPGNSLGDRIDVGQLWSDIGITITGKSRNNDPLGIFNSNCKPHNGTSVSGFSTPCGTSNANGDNDLATGKGSYGGISYDTDPQGNVLIFEENPGNGTPDDTARGGTIQFDFDRTKLSSVKLESIGILDDAKGWITINYMDGSLFEQEITNTEENELRFFSPGDLNLDKDVKKFTVRFTGSGAVSGVTFAELKSTPEPASLLGLAAVGGVGVGTWRKRRPKFLTVAD